MTAAGHQVLEAALRLSLKERAEIGAEIIASLHGEPDPGAEAAWAEEIDRRVRRVEAGGVKGETWPVVERKVRAALRRRRK